MHHILIIEDEIDLREALQLFLKNEGYSVHATETSAQGLKLLSEHVPDIILLDMMTHSLHGIEFLAELRKLPDPVGKAKVIVLTNLDAEITQEQAEKYGVSDYLVKASTPLKEIVNRVREVLSAA